MAETQVMGAKGLVAETSASGTGDWGGDFGSLTLCHDSIYGKNRSPQLANNVKNK